MSRVVVVGSGASGIHFALTLLEKGRDVLLLDAATEKPASVLPRASFDELKSRLDDPAAYFLGDRFEAVTLPGDEGSFYAFPPSKRHVFANSPGVDVRADGFWPLFSFAAGGLAEAWTAGVYPFNDAELEDFPFSYSDIAPYYAEVARRIGINGAEDDLARFFPVHEHLHAPLRLDRHGETLLRSYARHRDTLNPRGCFIGRSRIATLTSDRHGRRGCIYCGRCLWGCPSESLYTPSVSLRDCLGHPGFSYVPGVYVSHFTTRGARVSGVVTRPRAGGAPTEVPADALVLAAGTLSSTRIFLESVHRASGDIPALHGLMDNRQILMPYLNLHLLGSAYEPASYLYHQLAMGLEGETPRDYVHCQITTLTTAIVHPLVQKVPADLRTARILFRSLRAALGIVNVNLPDTRRDDSVVTLEPGDAPGSSRLVIRYAGTPDEPERIHGAMKRIRRALRTLGCVVPPGMSHVRPAGSGVHYAGTIPMSASSAPLTASPTCRSHDFDNLWFVDGTTFPSLPAKNITFTLMANAVRVADQAF